MEPIKDTVRQVIHSWDQELRSGKKNPQELLQGALSKKELQHAQAGSFNRGIFSINVESSSWMYYLGLKKEELLGKLRAQGAAVKEIRLYIGAAYGKKRDKARQGRRRAAAAGR